MCVFVGLGLGFLLPLVMGAQPTAAGLAVARPSTPDAAMQQRLVKPLEHFAVFCSSLRRWPLLAGFSTSGWRIGLLIAAILFAVALLQAVRVQRSTR